MKRLAVLVSLALAACSSGSPIIPAGFRGPVAVAPFTGMNPGRPEAGLVPLLAVASFRGNDLRLLDPNDDSPLAGANPAWALSVPTLERPTFLASGSLGDGLADLLVVAGTEPKVQVVGTWLDGTDGYGVVRTLDLSTFVPQGAQILSLAVARVPTGAPTGSPPVAPVATGRVWVVVGFNAPGDSGTGVLVLVQMIRAADGSIVLDAEPAGKQPVLAKPIQVTPTAMVAAPDNVHLYLASTEVIRDSTGREVLGIAEVTLSGDPDAIWPVRGFDARNSPTTTIAAAFVGERTQENFYTFAAPTLRVYAALDATGCGIGAAHRLWHRHLRSRHRRAGRRPGHAQASATWGVPKQSYRTPMVLAALPIAMAIAMPAVNPGSRGAGHAVRFAGLLLARRGRGRASRSVPPSPRRPPRRPSTEKVRRSGSCCRLHPPASSGRAQWGSYRPSTDSLYVQDLGRFGPVNAVSMLQDDVTRTQAFNASSVGPAGPVGNSSLFGFPAGTAALGLWSEGSSGSASGAVVFTAADLAKAITVWPGFTRIRPLARLLPGGAPGPFPAQGGSRAGIRRSPLPGRPGRVGGIE